MTYTEKELDQFLHGISLSLLSKKSAQHWRYDEETAKEIEWLEVLERKVRADKADRKTEPSNSEIPNNSTISKMEQVEDEFKQFDREDLILLIECQKERIAELLAKTEPQTNADQRIQDVESVETMSCEECKHFHENAVMYLDQCDFCFKDCKYELKDEPQTYVINPQEPTNDDKCFECDDFFTCGGQCNKIEDEPQTDCGWR